MSFLLGEPYLLASYPTPSQGFSISRKELKPLGHPLVNATCNSGHDGVDFATVSVQGDGIHVIELSNMHTAISHTLGPSVFFAAPSVTRFDGSGASTSYAIMQSATDGIAVDERGRAVWRWRNRLKLTEEQPKPKQSALFPRRVEKLWAPLDLPSHIIAISPSGDIMLSNDELKISAISEVPYPQSTLLRSWIFRLDDCTFLKSPKDDVRGVVVFCYVMIATKVKLRIILAQSTGELVDVDECDLGAHENVADISCDPTGYTTILTQGGEWRPFRLNRATIGSITAMSLGDALRLCGLSFGSSSSKRMAGGPSILSLGSSFILLAGISCESSTEVVLLLWDVQYSVVLASQTFALPSTLVSTPKSLPIVELVPASKSQALLVLSPAVGTGKRTATAVSSRSTIFVIPLAVPLTSTIALAMGRARDTQKWLQSIHTPSVQDDSHLQIINSVTQAIEQCRPQAAEAAFFAWINKERNRNIRPSKAELTFGSNTAEKHDNGGSTSTGQHRGSHKSKGQPLTHRFVTSILKAILESPKSPDVSYSSKIVQYLIGREAVGNAMIEGGLLPSLRRHQDWETIASAFRCVHDLPENDIIQLLADIVRSHRQCHNPRSDGRDVDAPSTPVPPPVFLAMVVRYQMSPTMLRMALKTHLTDVADIIYVLETLTEWLGWWWCDTNSGMAVSLGESSPSATGFHHASENGEPKEVPSLAFVISFLQSVLDAHFLKLLQYPPAHSLMERMSRQSHEQLTFVDDLDRLRRPLEAFVRGQSRKVRMRHTEAASGVDYRKRRKEVSQATEIAIGMYQIEELVI